MSRRASVKVSPVSCKVCKDAGLPESRYNSHRVKNAQGKVCCPTLLSARCRRCEKTGHTAGYCTVILDAGAEKEARRQEHEAKAQEQKQHKCAAVAVKNAFSELAGSDSESDEELSPNVTVRAKPATKPVDCTELSPNVTVRIKPTIRATKRSWADDSDDEDW